MIKLLEIMTRKEGLTHEEFVRHWLEIHGPLVSNIPGVRRYVQNHPVKLSAGDPPFDGIAEVWYDDIKSWRASMDWYKTDKAKAIHDDEKEFIDLKKTIHLIAEEKVIKEK